jgi:5-methylcytosine-specific restriction endonuclease McrA
LVLERDGYKCVKCGSEEPLHCHHIYPVSTNPLESTDIDNCITLCIDCHKKVHQKDGCQYNQLNICIE